ncbi:MAG: hypothetical protein FWD19_05225 [Defluviitaleaceae bacterium]|nr:hypothetical protein [Defluviitaleaceae bacterium]
MKKANLILKKLIALFLVILIILPIVPNSTIFAASTDDLPEVLMSTEKPTTQSK